MKNKTLNKTLLNEIRANFTDETLTEMLEILYFVLSDHNIRERALIATDLSDDHVLANILIPLNSILNK